jgi:excisionase family DNA binding protein
MRVERDFISTTEASERLGISRQTLASYLRQGKLRGVKFGKEWRIPRNELDRLLAPRVEEEPQV